MIPRGRINQDILVLMTPGASQGRLPATKEKATTDLLASPESWRRRITTTRKTECGREPNGGRVLNPPTAGFDMGGLQIRRPL